MNNHSEIEDDDLALHAMKLLAEPEAARVAQKIKESAGTRKRAAEIYSELALYAEAHVEIYEVPDGSLQRLMERVAADKKILAWPNAANGSQLPIWNRPGLGTWLGWALAATLLIVAGLEHRSRTSLSDALQEQDRRATSSEVAANQEARTLQAKLAERTAEVQQLRSSSMRTSIPVDFGKAMPHQAAETAAAIKERDLLKQTIANQSDQITQLTAAAVNGQHLLDALQDRTALRVTLMKPKVKATPTGRATYVASRGTLVFLASNLAPLKPNKVYELWLMPADGSSPVPAGTFVPDFQGSANLVYAQFSPALSAKGFTVTIEKEGGSQVPTLPIVLAGL